MFSDDRLTPSNRAVGQVVEWLVWAAVVGNAARLTHVFLPLDDRGVDGIVRRVDDEAMCAVQVKGRTVLRDGGLEIVVNRSALDDPHVTFVVAHLDPVSVRLGDFAYVMDAETVLHLGSHGVKAPETEVALFLPYPPHPRSRSGPYACHLSELSSRLFPSAGVPPPRRVVLREPRLPAPPRESALLGHLAELQVMWLLGEADTLNTFKSFPDLEEAEYLVRHRPTGGIYGVQVKCLIVPDADTQGQVVFNGLSFVPSPTTDYVILAWRRDQHRFDDGAWLIPAVEIPHVVKTFRRTSRIELRIGSTRGSQFDRFRLPRSGIASALETHLQELQAGALRPDRTPR